MCLHCALNRLLLNSDNTSIEMLELLLQYFTKGRSILYNEIIRDVYRNVENN